MSEVRAYRAKTRPQAVLALRVRKLPENQLRILEDHFFEEAMADGSLLHEAYSRTADDWIMIDVLKNELRNTPNSPVSLELKRRVRAMCKKQAKEVAAEILIGD